VQRAARDLLFALDADVDADGLREAPRRVADVCMSLRGVEKFGSNTVTSALHGQIRDDARTRQEFLALATRTSHDQ
jgi:GTP cyclohydrolase I